MKKLALLSALLGVLVAGQAQAAPVPTVSSAPAPAMCFSVEIGSSMTCQTVTLSRSPGLGTQTDVALGALTDTVNFSIVSSDCAVLSDETSATCTIVVSFHPTSAGFFSASMDLTYTNVSGNPGDTVTFQGSGTEPEPTGPTGPTGYTVKVPL